MLTLCTVQESSMYVLTVVLYRRAASMCFYVPYRRAEIKYVLILCTVQESSKKVLTLCIVQESSKYMF